MLQSQYHAFGDGPLLDVHGKVSFISSLLGRGPVPYFRKNAKLGKGVRVGPNAFIKNFSGPESIKIGEDTVIRGLLRAGDLGPAKLEIGSNTYVGDSVIINATQEVKIGDNCLIAHGVQIMDYDGHELDPIRRLEDWEIISGKKRGPRPSDIPRGRIQIGNNVWVGMNSILLKNIKIGDNSVIAAGSVVTSDVPANCVYGGNPARLLMELKSS